MSRSRWYGPTARPEQGPMPEGGSETYVFTFVLVRPGQPEGKGESLATWELTPDQYRERGGHQGMRREVDTHRRQWAALARRRGHEGSVIVIKRRGFRRSLWAVPAGVQ